MYWQGGGWYEISANRTEEDWATDDMMMKALIRKIRKVLTPNEEVSVGYTVPVVVKAKDGMHLKRQERKVQKPELVHSSNITVSVPAPVTPVVYGERKPQVPLSRLEALQRRINSKYHH